MMESSRKVLVTAEDPKLILPDVRKQDNLMDHEKKEDTWTLPYLIDEQSEIHSEPLQRKSIICKTFDHRKNSRMPYDHIR